MKKDSQTVTQKEKEMRRRKERKRETYEEKEMVSGKKTKGNSGAGRKKENRRTESSRDMGWGTLSKNGFSCHLSISVLKLTVG